MKKFLMLLPVGLIALALIATPATTLAIRCPGGAVGVTGDTPCELPDDYSHPADIIETLERVTGWLFTFLLIFAVIMFIWAAYLYLFSGGSEESTAKAKNYLIYGVIGIAVAMLSKGIPFIIYNLL